MRFKHVLNQLLCTGLSLGMILTLSGCSESQPAPEIEKSTPFLTIKDGGYLSTVGSDEFNVFMYDNTFSGIFGDQHMGGIELSLHGLRIATNGDIHYLPTPEQWDATPAPSAGEIIRDTASNTITVPMTYTGSPDGTLEYNLIASPSEQGVRLQVELKSEFPKDLSGKARFNLEFIPLAYRDRSFQSDTDGDGTYDEYGIFPHHPGAELAETKRSDLPDQSWYVQEWNEERGEAQPYPFARGVKLSLAPEDENYAVVAASLTGVPLELYDGRNRAQNGWYVLSMPLTDGKAGDIIADWEITPCHKENWIRKPNVGFSQAGYAPYQEKFAVVELDRYDTSCPQEMSLLRVNADGSEETVRTGRIEDYGTWQRYHYARFDFSDVTETGMYRLQYGDQKCEIFPIADDVYDNIWQAALDGFLTVAMDHMEVRDGYKIWHGAAHMDDGTIGDRDSTWFDGMMMNQLPDWIKERGIRGEDHLEGLNQGGWYDAGDFDLEMHRNFQVLDDLIKTAQSTNCLDGYDNLTVTWDKDTGGSAEMHRPDGIPDIVQHVIHGSKQVLGEYEAIGGTGGCMEVRSLRQYTHLGDPSSDTDGYIYDSSLGENEIVERDGKVYSGKPDDRYLLTRIAGGDWDNEMFGPRSYEFAATAALAAPYKETQEYAAHIFEAALGIWQNAEAPETDWDNVVQYTLASKALEDAGVKYKGSDTYNYDYFRPVLDRMLEGNLDAGRHINVLALKDILTKDQWQKVGESVKAAAQKEEQNEAPYGVDFTMGSSWGGSPKSYEGQINNALMYYSFPEENFKTNILRSVDYILGRHPATNASWISGVGTKSALHPYNSNRADESFIPGSILPGYITFNDYVESLDDFSFLWFENESIISYQASWLSVGFAAGLIAHAGQSGKPAPTKDFDSSFDADLITMKQTANDGTEYTDGYLAGQGFNMLMYSTTFDRTFGDQHCAGIELVQNGRRIATNGDIRLLPTPEQWDATPATIRGERVFDEETGTVTINMTLPAETFEDHAKDNPEVIYQLIAKPEKGGIELTLKLDEALPEDLLGKAGFNLEFLPSVFIGKSIQCDSNGDGTYDDFGVFPLIAEDDMEEVGRARTANQAWYVQEWNDDRGDYQPVPLFTGSKMTFASEDSDYRIRVSCQDGMSLFDGRDRAQNGWFVLRTLIPEGKKEIVWHISPDTAKDWSREPVISHNQAGYEPGLAKAAVIELDSNYQGAMNAVLSRLEADGTWTDVKTASLKEAEAMPWMRYEYRTFDFSDVTDPGMYRIRFDEQKSDLFPIREHVYADIWKQSVGSFLAIQMDHMRIRDGYKIWRNPAHMDDALQAPWDGLDWFDGWHEGTKSDTPYEAYEHIPGLDQGGFCDAGDFDIQTGANLHMIQNLALACQVYGSDYDTLSIDWDAHSVELHRPDGIPDLPQLVKHGVLQMLGQYENIGFLASVIEVPSLRQYTHIGDGSKDTDNRVYDPALSENEINGLRSGKQDDRLAFAFTKNTTYQLSAAAAFAMAADVLKGIDDELAERCRKAAEQIWQEESDSHKDSEDGKLPADWNAAIELFHLTGRDVYKERLLACFDRMMDLTMSGRGGSPFASQGWKAFRIMDQLDETANDAFDSAIAAYAETLNQPANPDSPWGVSDTYGMWGGAGTVAASETAGALLYRYLSEKHSGESDYVNPISLDRYYRTIDYVLGCHPYNSTSWISAVGTSSATMAYGSNRAERFYIAGGLVPGYVPIAPDFPEHLDDFNFLWFENEYRIDMTSNWILSAMAADELAR